MSKDNMVADKVIGVKNDQCGQLVNAGLLWILVFQTYLLVLHNERVKDHSETSC